MWWRKRKSGKPTVIHNLFATSSIDKSFESKNVFSTSTERNIATKVD
jgi:hypothetical protein